MTKLIKSDANKTNSKVLSSLPKLLMYYFFNHMEFFLRHFD